MACGSWLGVLTLGSSILSFWTSVCSSVKWKWANNDSVSRNFCSGKKRCFEAMEQWPKPQTGQNLWPWLPWWRRTGNRSRNWEERRLLPTFLAIFCLLYVKILEGNVPKYSWSYSMKQYSAWFFLLSSQHFLDFVICLKCACVTVIIRKDEGGKREGIT